MTKEFCKTSLAVLMSGTILSFAATAQAQTCTVAPTCESLGYTMSADNCTGKKTLKCPFDINKLYCVTEAGLANVNFGDVMFEDHTTSSPYTYIAKTPIGVVIGKTSDSLIIAHIPHKTLYNFQMNFGATIHWNGKIPGRNGTGQMLSGTTLGLNNRMLTLPMYNILKDWQNSNDSQGIYKAFLKLQKINLTNNTLADYGVEKGSGQWLPAQAVLLPPMSLFLLIIQ